MMHSLSAKSRRKVNLIFANASLILLLSSIAQMRWATVNIEDSLGLTAKIPFQFWIGLFIIFICIIDLYFSKEAPSAIVCIYIIGILVLFLFGIGIFTEENPRNISTYGNIAQLWVLQNTGSVEVGSKYPLISYRDWPGYLLLSYAITTMTNIELFDYLRYLPLFFVFMYLLFGLAIARCVQISSHNTIFLCSYFVISLWSAHQWYPSPQSLVFAMYILVFLFALIKYFKPSNIQKKANFLIFITFTSIVISHLITATVTLVATFSACFWDTFKAILTKLQNAPKIGYFISKRKVSDYLLVFALGTIFTVWFVYAIPDAFGFGFGKIMNQIISLDYDYFVGTTKFQPVTELKQVVNRFRLAFLLVNAVLVVSAIFLYLKGNIADENKKNVFIFCLCWIVGVVPLVAVQYGNEIFERVYGFVLVPAVCIITVALSDIFSKYKVIVPSIIFILLLLHVPAHYGSECYDSVKTTELVGVDFFTSKAVPGKYLYSFTPIVRFANPDYTTVPVSKVSVWDPELNIDLQTNYYVINSYMTDQILLYHIGFNPLQSMDNTSFNRVYDNARFTLYYNPDLLKH